LGWNFNPTRTAAVESGRVSEIILQTVYDPSSSQNTSKNGEAMYPQITTPINRRQPLKPAEHGNIIDDNVIPAEASLAYALLSEPIQLPNRIVIGTISNHNAPLDPIASNLLTTSINTMLKA